MRTPLIVERDPFADIFYILRTGAPWRDLPERYGPRTTVYIFADGAYAGPKLAGALKKIGDWALEIVRRNDKADGFVALPRRWVVERTFAWFGRSRRLAKLRDQLEAVTGERMSVLEGIGGETGKLTARDAPEGQARGMETEARKGTPDPAKMPEPKQREHDLGL